MKKQFIRRLTATLSILFIGLIQVQGQEITSKPTYICVEDWTQYSIPTTNLPTGAYGYTWSIEKGTTTTTGSNGSSTYTVVWHDGPTAQVKFSYKYDVPKKDANGNVMKDSKGNIIYETLTGSVLSTEVQMVNPPSIPLPTIFISTATGSIGNIICPGQVTTLIANVSGGTSAAEYSYLWSDLKTTQAINVSPAVGTTTYKVQIKNQCNMAYITSPGFGVTVKAAPDFTITSGTSGKVCPKANVTLTATPVNSSSNYTYSWTPATTPATGSQVVASPTVTTKYKATATDAVYGCKTTKEYNIDVYPMANVTIPDAEILVCGAPATFTLTPSGADNYSYNPDGALNPKTGSPVTGTLSPANSPLSITIIGTNGGCANTASYKYVKVFAGVPKAETINGFADGINGPVSPAYLCLNPIDQNYTISTASNPVSKTSYYWYFTDPMYASFGNYNGYGLTAVNAHFNTGYTGTKTIEVKATNACGSAIISRFDNIISGTTPSSVPAKPTGPDAVSSSDISTFQTGLIDGGLEWQVIPSGVTRDYTNFSTGTTNVYWNTSYTGTAYVMARNKNGCGTGNWSDPKGVTVGPPKVLSLTGKSVVDNSENTIFQTSLVAGTKTWQVLPASAVQSMKTISMERLSVIWNPSFTGNVTVNVSCSGYLSPSPKTVTVTSGQCDNIDNNNTKATAYDISLIDPQNDPDARRSGVISDANDIDWFMFSTYGTKTNIDVQLTNLLVDFDVELYNSDGTWFAGSYNGSYASERIIYNASFTGTYYIKIYGYGGRYSTQCYYLNVNSGSTMFTRIADDNTFEEKVQPGELFSVYPNPAEVGTEVLLVIPEGEGITTQSVTISDINGKTVYESDAVFTEGRSQIILDKLTSGIYLIDVKGLGKKKLVVH